MSAEPTRCSPTRLGALVLIPLLAALALATASFTGRLDGTPPELRWGGVDLSAPVAGELALAIEVHDDRPGLGAVQFRVDGAVVTGASLDTGRLADGHHELTVVARDRSWRRNVAELGLTFVSDNTAPELALANRSRTARQGDTLALFIRAGEGLAGLTASLLEREVTFHSIGDGSLHRALVGVSVKREAGAHPVTLSAIDRAGNITDREFALVVAEVEFPPGGYVNLNPAQQKAQKDRSKADEANAKRREAYGHVEQEQLWGAAFLRPATGRVTSPFGRYRQYSSGIRSHHLGLDIANVEGTPIHAAGHGVVTLAEELHIYGNAVIVSHGQGVSTSYNHLSAIDVEVGQRVEAGQVVGKMGSTGQSTGSHLHWGMVVAGTAVDPGQWIETDFMPQEQMDFQELDAADQSPVARNPPSSDTSDVSIPR
jgi:murein DD-endopeptidase MepM/ murein hydrolase activator NlpD